MVMAVRLSADKCETKSWIGVSGIYRIEDEEGRRSYIGSAVSLGNRWRQHYQSLDRSAHHSKFLQRSWNKHGRESFTFNVLLTCRKKDLLFYEQLCLDAFNPEFNTAKVAGSQLGLKMSQEARAKMSASRRKDFSPMTGKNHSEETKRKISKNRKGKYTGARPESVGRKISAALLGRTISKETKEKLRQANLGKKQSEETIAKRVKKLRGRKMSSDFCEMKRKWLMENPFSDESKLKGRKTKSKFSDEEVLSIRQRCKNGESQRKVALDKGVDPSCISDLMRGKTYDWVK